MKTDLLRPILFVLIVLLFSVSCGGPGGDEAAREKQKTDSVANAQEKMEEAKEEALRRARVMEDSIQQSQASSSKE